MPPSTFAGLPAHALLVHVVVVLVPLTSVLLLLAVFWPAARRKLSLLTMVLGFVSLVSVPLTTQAGEWLEHRTASTDLLRRHAELGDGLLPWVAGLFVVTVLVWLRDRQLSRESPGGTGGSRVDQPRVDQPMPAGVPAGGPGRFEADATMPAGGVDTATRERAAATGWLAGSAAGIVVVVLALAAAVGSVVDTYLIGDAGAKAVWTGSFSDQPVNGGDDG